MAMCTGEGMTPGEPVLQAQLLGTRNDRAFDRGDVGDHGSWLQMWNDSLELRDIGGGWRGQHQEIGGARDIDGAGWRIVEGALLSGQRPLCRFRRPTYDRDSPGPRA